MRNIIILNGSILKKVTPNNVRAWRFISYSYSQFVQPYNMNQQYREI